VVGFRILTVLGVISLVLAIYWWIARPYQLHWGATPEEISRIMPGDELTVSPTFLATRAITINAKPEQIWPWLLQMGYNRAGFYGYDLIENQGSSSGLKSADKILPQFQSFQPGDEVPISAVSSMVFYAIEPDKYLVWTGKEGIGNFTWALYPVDDTHTRLVSRIGWSHHMSPVGVLALDVFTEFADHLAVRKILQGIKGRVEGTSEPEIVQNVEIGMFLSAFFLFCAGLILLLVRPLTWWTGLAGLISGLVWLVTWYTPVPVWFGFILEASVLAGLVFSRK
jgi:hypothetical protein